MKDTLKKIKFFYVFNSILKSIFLKKRYNKLRIKYSIKKYYNTMSQVFDEVWINSFNSKVKPIVYFIGTDESQDRGGLIPDLQELAELFYFKKYDGGYGQYSGLLNYNGVQGRILNTKKIIEDLNVLIEKGKKPDFILMQAWGRSFDIKVLKNYKNDQDLKFINISLDDRLVFTDKTPSNELHNFGISGLTTLVDLFLVSNPEVVNWYHTENVNAIYFPMASSLKFFHPISLEKKYDVGFIGNRYGYRGELIDYLVLNGIRVQAYGRGWKDGYLDSSKANEFFNQCKIVLGVGTVGHSSDFFTQKLRDFDAPLSGAVYITNNNMDLLELYPNGEIILAGSKKDFVKNIHYLLASDDVRLELSKKAFYTAKHQHTYKYRFEELFKLLGGANEI